MATLPPETEGEIYSSWDRGGVRGGIRPLCIGPSFAKERTGERREDLICKWQEGLRDDVGTIVQGEREKGALH